LTPWACTCVRVWPLTTRGVHRVQTQRRQRPHHRPDH
jgi:hypothetical protein